MLPFGNFQKDFNRNYKSTKNWKTKKTDNAEATQSIKNLYPFKEVLVIKSKYPAQIWTKYCFMILSNLVLAIEVL